MTSFFTPYNRYMFLSIQALPSLTFPSLQSLTPKSTIQIALKLRKAKNGSLFPLAAQWAWLCMLHAAMILPSNKERYALLRRIINIYCWFFWLKPTLTLIHLHMLHWIFIYYNPRSRYSIGPRQPHLPHTEALQGTRMVPSWTILWPGSSTNIVGF